MNRKISLTIIVICTCIVISVLVFLCLTQGTGIVLPFEKVGRFSRKARFLCIFGQNKALLLNVSDPAGFSYREILESNKLGHRTLHDSNFVSPVAVTVRPDGSRFYICINDELAEYDRRGTLLRRISITEFELGQNKYGFSDTLQASNEFLWLSVDSLLDRVSFVMQWQPSHSPKTREIGPEAIAWSIDPYTNRVFIFGEKCGVFDFKSKEFVEKDWSGYDFFDFARGHGLLMSSSLANGRADRITLVDLTTDLKTDITWGSMAQWGSDGYIYFVRGSTQLWRCKPNSNDPEPVYLATMITRGGYEGFGTELKLSYDRSLLAFHYRIERWFSKEHYNGFSSKYRCGILLLDLTNHVYKELTEKDFCSICLEMDAEKLISLDSMAYRYMVMEKDFWHIENMAWVTEESDFQSQ